MYAIINKNSRFVSNNVTKYFLVASFRFTEVGYQVKLTRTADNAKQYKRYQAAYNAATGLGSQYQVISL